MTDQASHLDLFTGQNFQASVEAHGEVAVCVGVEYLGERLLEHRCGEGVRQNHMSAGAIGQTFHLEQTYLVKAASKDVDDMAIVCCSFRKLVVKFQRFLVVLDVVPVDVMM